MSACKLWKEITTQKHCTHSQGGKAGIRREYEQDYGKLESFIHDTDRRCSQELWRVAEPGVLLEGVPPAQGTEVFTEARYLMQDNINKSDQDTRRIIDR